MQLFLNQLRKSVFAGFFIVLPLWQVYDICDEKLCSTCSVCVARGSTVFRRECDAAKSFFNPHATF
jgi:hypothetical protein